MSDQNATGLSIQPSKSGSDADRVPLSAAAEKQPSLLCPYCGHLQPVSEQCQRCRGLFEPLSRQATQNAMGPWQVRSEKNPFTPGFSYDKLKEMVEKGRIGRFTVIRGPSTRQFWFLACNAPGVAVLLGECHNCHGKVLADDYLCKSCGAVLTCSTDRQFMGLGPVQLLPGDAAPSAVASTGMLNAVVRPSAPDGPQVSKARGIDHPPSPIQQAKSSSSISVRRAQRRQKKGSRTALLTVVLFIVILAIIGFAALSRSSTGFDRAVSGLAPAPQQPAIPR